VVLEALPTFKDEAAPLAEWYFQHRCMQPAEISILVDYLQKYRDPIEWSSFVSNKNKSITDALSAISKQ